MDTQENNPSQPEKNPRTFKHRDARSPVATFADGLMQPHEADPLPAWFGLGLGPTPGVTIGGGGHAR